MDFGCEWAAVEGRLRRYCEARLRDRDLADELMQITHIEAWRGRESFQGRSSFLTWVTTIARRNIETVLDQRTHGIEWDGQVDLSYEAPENPAAAELHLAFQSALAQAVTDGDVSVRDADICQTYLSDPEVTWADVASRVGATSTHCAVIHMRTMSKVRVTMFLSGHPCLGGRSNVMRALAAALGASADQRLTVLQEQVFRAAVFGNDRPSDAVRRNEHLREACRKVALHILKV